MPGVFWPMTRWQGASKSPAAAAAIKAILEIKGSILFHQDESARDKDASSLLDRHQSAGPGM
jgi:hypothetical protein